MFWKTENLIRNGIGDVRNGRVAEKRDYAAEQKHQKRNGFVRNGEGEIPFHSGVVYVMLSKRLLSSVLF